MKPLPQWARGLQRKLETATTCKTCGGKTLVANVSGGRRPVLERVTPETHCTCAGGPVDQAAHSGDDWAEKLKRMQRESGDPDVPPATCIEAVDR